MEHKQLELDFSCQAECSAEVIDINETLHRRAQERLALQRSRAIAEILKSVEHISGRSSEAEAM